MEKHYSVIKEGKEIMQKGSDLIELLRDKLEIKMVNNTSIITILSTSAGECRNTFSVDDFEIDDDYLYLSSNNYELSLDLKETNLIYDENLDCFKFAKNDTSIFIYFSLHKLN